MTDKKETGVNAPARLLAVIDARVKLINGHFELPQETKKEMEDIRNACQAAAEEIQAIVTHGKVKYDAGRIIHALDLLQQVKDTACVALILPHAPQVTNEPVQLEELDVAADK